ncbi:MAG: L-seryl-tRNA(Sec) selenium transferase [Verrucomicrobia bacterium]|nr:L-seryl-tRNA(Sec) selenium transferase [Verrucomicrobiota bacterium]
MKRPDHKTPLPSLRAIPAVEKILQSLGAMDLPRPAVVAVVRRELGALREEKTIPEFSAVLARVHSALDDLRRAKIQPVINGTGVILHTNLGRAPLSGAVVETLASVAANYNNLEFNLATGERGERAAYLEHNLALLCGAEAATVTNNCAAALVLILRHFTAGGRKQVVISRGELVQIGGGFRIPEVLEASGAQLREVGTTNKTSLGDYAKAINHKTAMILKVHRSNFFMGGFVEEPATEELAALARRKRVPFVEDLGSGATIAIEKVAAIEHEPTPAEVLKRGVDLVCFSGDKLLGGPQAGIIVGRRTRIAALKREPFFRALRCDKLILAALQTTLDAYLSGSADADLSESSKRKLPTPVLEMLAVSSEDLRLRAEKIIAVLNGLPIKAAIGEGKAQLGGGTMPCSAIPSVTIDLQPTGLALSEFAARLRRATSPVIGHISGNRFKLDLRTVFPRQDGELIEGILSAVRLASP